MPQNKTNESFILELKEKAPNIIPLEKYINSQTKIKCECTVCGNQWSVAPAYLLYGKGCPICSGKRSADKRRCTKETFSTKLHAANPNIDVIGDYINSQTKIEVHCKKCGNTWSVAPYSLLNGTGCPKCNKRYRRNTEDFINELKAISPHIVVLGEYKNAHTRIQVKCTRCNTEWFSEPNGLLKGNDCPVCGHSQTSTVEQVLYRAFAFLLGPEKVFNREKNTIGKELDVLIPSLSLAFEFGAWYWHSSKIQYDYEKEHLCNLAGIRLITLYEGCPPNADTGNLANAICYTTVISNEKDYHTIKDFIIQICQDYALNSSSIVENWHLIIKEAKEESRKRDAEQFSQALASANPEVIYLGEYTGSNNTVFVQCKKCGIKWHASSAYDVLHGHGCPECAKTKRGETQRMSARVFKERAQAINPVIELLEDYKGNSVGILCKCKKCGTEWTAPPQSLIQGKRNCPKCSPVTRKTNEQFLEELSKISDTIIPLDLYKNGRTKLHFKCKICGYEWEASPSSVLQGTGCPKCAHRVKRTSEEFVRNVETANRNTEVIGTYIDGNTKVECRCKTCGYRWLGLPKNLLRGAGCQKCAGTLRLSDDEFKKRLFTINPTIQALETYINSSTKILCHCKKCGYDWKAQPSNILNGHGCPKCKAINAKKHRERKVICEETGIIYDSVSEAKTQTKITTISDCLNNRTKTAGGYHWAYVKD